MTRDRLKSTFVVILLGASILIAGCAKPPVDENLQQVRQRLESARADDVLRAEAGGPIADAERTLAQADEADDPAMVHHFTYLAGKNLDIAKAVVARKRAEDRLAELRSHREETGAAHFPAGSNDVQVKRVPSPPADNVLPENGGAQRASSGVNTREADRLLRDLEKERRQMVRREDREIERQVEESGTTTQKVGPQKSRAPAVQPPAELHFANGSTELLPGARRLLDPIIVRLREDPQVKVIVEGHTDSSGTHQANLATSLARAYAVKDYLVDSGIAEERIQTLGLGASYPVASNRSEEGRQRNRRVQIIVAPPSRDLRPSSRLR